MSIPMTVGPPIAGKYNNSSIVIILISNISYFGS
jgi:hypothetical protein